MTASADGATAAERAVAGLAREVEALARQVNQLRGLPRRVEEVALLVARLAEYTTASSAPDGDLTETWLEAPADRVGSLLVRLVDWLGSVYLRYADGARGLPACWLWHPEVVEELVWLRQAWLAAYADPQARTSLAADWHDRLRPGVVRRIRDYAGMCSIEAHLGTPAAGAPTVPLDGAVPLIVSWWADARSASPPEPGEAELAAANAYVPGSSAGVR